MECALVPQDCIKPVQTWIEEQNHKDSVKSFACTTRKATPVDIVQLVPKNTLTLDIFAEMGLSRKQDKKPEFPFELGLNQDERSRNNG